jgi:hypothetical protein
MGYQSDDGDMRIAGMGISTNHWIKSDVEISYYLCVS